MSRSDDRLKPRNGHTLVVGIVARISGCQNQKEMSLDDQVDHAKQVVVELYEGPVDYRTIATKGKGEALDRPELDQIEQMLRTGKLDLLIAEDIGRMVRGIEAAHICGIAVDHGTRVLAPNDCIDTADDSWEEDVISACRDHVGHNAHTSKRLKQKLMNRFRKFGGATPREIYGYVKPEGAKTFDEWQKDPAATPIIQEGLRRLKATLNCSAVADWFNQQGAPTGKYRRTRKKWTGAMIRKFYCNPILKGQPGRGFRHTVKHNETGRRIAMKNPKGPIFLDCPNLAHLDPVEFDELNALLGAKNSLYHRKPINGVDPRAQVPRKRTRFPGQHARCWYCGRRFVWGANGATDGLMCPGSREWRCWNSVGFNGPLAAERLVTAATAELYSLQGFDAQFAELVMQAQWDRSGAETERWQKLRSGEESLQREQENFQAAIAQYGPRPMFHDKLLELEAREKELARERYQLESLGRRELQLPQSVEELRGLLEEKFRLLAVNSPEFGDLMRLLVPEFHVYLVRLLDGGHMMPRAKVKLALGGIVPDIQHVPGLGDLLAKDLTLDLFDRPYQRERIRQEAVCLAGEGLTQRQIAAQLSERPKLPVVQRALALDRKMKELGLDSPYAMVLAPPDDYPKFRRHRNSQYRFVPQDGYQQPVL
jgi:site-specific DNA recombinase